MSRAIPAAELSALIAARVVIVAGKGGVGKTTVTAVLARAAAERGRRVLVIELDGKPVLEQLLPGIEVRCVLARDALDEYLRDHGFTRIAKRLASTGVIDVVGTAAPGIDDVVVLGKVKHLERSGEWDLIVVDGPAAGHAITFLTSAIGLADAVSGGPVRAQSDDVLELLRDPERCQVVLVTVPEATPVNELVETAFALEDRVGVQLGPIVVNGVDDGPELPDPDAVDLVAESDADAAALRAAARYRLARRAMQRAELGRLAVELPLPAAVLPLLPVAGITSDDIDRLARGLAGDGVEP